MKKKIVIKCLYKYHFLYLIYFEKTIYVYLKLFDICLQVIVQLIKMQNYKVIRFNRGSNLTVSLACKF